MILCAVDDSEAAGRVLDTARWLADSLQSGLVVLHVVDDGSSEADELVDRVRSRLGDVRVDLQQHSGSPAETIRDAADREDADFVVVGSRGRGGLRSAVLGSVSRELVADAHCPVVVVPSGERWALAPNDQGDSASVVCGVDGSHQALDGAAFAGRLAQRLGCRLIVVHARQNVRAALSYRGARSETPPVSGQSDAVEELTADVLQRAVAAAGGSADGVIEPGPPAEVLESVANREAARLIVITTRGLGGVRAARLGSVAGELTATAARPVVVLSEASASAARAEVD